MVVAVIFISETRVLVSSFVNMSDGVNVGIDLIGAVSAICVGACVTLILASEVAFCLTRCGYDVVADFAPILPDVSSSVMADGDTSIVDDTGR